MQEHAIPQDVTGYKFHIVGNMTLGQFGQLVLGAILAFGLYSTNLYGIIKWPMIGVVVLLSVVAAFIPIAERPLSHWITTFFKVLYQPTQFAWKRIPHIPDVFLFKPAEDTGPVLPELDLTPLRRKRIQEFLSTTHAQFGVDEEAQQTNQYYEHVFSLFNTQSPATSLEQEPIQVNKPSLRVRTRSLRENPSTPISVENALSTPEPLADPEVVVPEVVIPEAVEAPAPITTDNPSMLFTTSKSLEIAARNSAENSAGSALSVPEIDMPVIDATNSESEANAAGVDGAEATTGVEPAARTLVTQQQQKKNLVASTVTFNKQLPFPSKPTTPNKLVGMILSSAADLIEGAIIEIRSPEGQVVRAVRSNALGQFYVTTPLANGEYILVVEKIGRRFEPLSIKLKGKIVDPIEIRSLD